MTQITDRHLIQRLCLRAHQDETLEDVIARALDETATEVTLETVVTEAMREFDHIDAIVLKHNADFDNRPRLEIVIYTTEITGSVQSLPLFGPDYELIIEHGEQRMRLPFSVVAAGGIPRVVDRNTSTPIYVDASVPDTVPIALKDGLTYFQNKISFPEEWSRSDDSGLNHICNYRKSNSGLHD